MNFLPNNKVLDQSKLKTFADKKINVTEKLKLVLGRVEKTLWEKDKKLVTSVFSFYHNFFKRFLAPLAVGQQAFVMVCWPI